ncbi:NAD(P)-binding protein, partial [Westerdykella ornata]
VKNVILVGASGNLGPIIVKTFARHAPHFNFSILTRHDSNSTSTFPANIPVLRADYSSLDSLTAAFKDQDAVVSLVGPAFLAKQTILVDAAIAAGVKLFLPSEYGSDTADERLREVVPMFEVKKNIVDYLKQREDKISWSAVIVGGFFDWGITSTFLGFNASTKTATLVDNGTVPFTTTNTTTIARALIAILSNPSVARNQYVYISSFTPTGADILAAAERITGAQWTVKHVSSDDLVKDGKEKVAKGDRMGVVSLLLAGLLGKEGLGDNRKKGSEEWNQRLGLEGEDFEGSVR